MKRVLIISHNVFSKTSSMGKTLYNFFCKWNKADIAQLYFHTEVPTTDLCENYFRITDFDIIKKRKKDIGIIFKNSNKCLISGRVDKGVEAKVYKYGKKRKPYMYIGRNFLWGLNKWKNKKLTDWIDEFDPEVIFYASGDYIFSYNIAMYIAKYKNIPIVTYVCDDYYFIKQKSVSPLYHINRALYKNTLKSLFGKYRNTVMICDKLSQDYKKEFDVNPVTIMTTGNLCLQKNKKNSNFIISYIGNMGYNRYIPLVEIGKCLKQLFNDKIVLDVYSMENREEIVSYLTVDNGINFHGGISSDKVNDVMEQSDILIHVESMNEVCMEKVKYSVSTKIADSLASGTFLFAYGPKDVASIQYLQDCEGAYVVTDKNELSDSLKKVINDKNLRKKYIENALIAANKNHNLQTNCMKIYNVIENA